MAATAMAATASTSAVSAGHPATFGPVEGAGDVDLLVAAAAAGPALDDAADAAAADTDVTAAFDGGSAPPCSTDAEEEEEEEEEEAEKGVGGDADGGAPAPPDAPVGAGLRRPTARRMLNFSHFAPPPAADDMPSIFLVGPMGSGKSTVGRALARAPGFASSTAIGSWRHAAGSTSPPSSNTRVKAVSAIAKRD